MQNLSSIFVKGKLTLESLVFLISSTLGIELEKQRLESGILYTGMVETKDISIEVFDNHGLVNDCGIEFEKYNYHVSIESNDRRSDVQECRNDRLVLAKKVIDKLNETDSIETILVEGLQELIKIS